MQEEVMFEIESTTEDPSKERYAIGRNLVLTISGQTAMLYRASIYIRTVDLSDKTARRLFPEIGCFQADTDAFVNGSTGH